MHSPHRVLLDTDIGSDVDDALALATILGSPDIDLIGVTTVYGDTGLRAQIASRYLTLAGRNNVPVAAGEPSPLSGRPVWWPGHEGDGHTHIDEQEFDEGISGPDLLVRSVLASPGTIDVVAIGPLTNLAVALSQEPAFSENVRRIWIMGGAFDRDAPEHNIQSDTFAAQRVFDSDAPITVLPLDVTERIRLTHKDVEAIRQSGPVGEQLGIDIRRWWEVRGTAWNVPHDPLTLLALCHPDLFELSPAGRVQVDPLSGTTSFDPGQSGNVRIATDLDTPRVTDLLMRTLTNSSVRTAAR